MDRLEVKGQLVDIFEARIYPAIIRIENRIISDIREVDSAPDQFIMPGFIDAHVHIESSMLIPSEFARLAVVHGTLATVSDPHEIGNVLGVEGVKYMIENGKKVPFYFNFGAPSCVPATSFETAGAEISARDVESLLEMEEVKYLSEMMNFPGVLNGDPEVMAKIRSARSLGKPVDGHAPGLMGPALEKYIRAGISTDHECTTYDEGLEKLKKGMKIIIREGSAAKNFDALIDLIDGHSDRLMFCSDDKHPDSLVEGHINTLAARAVAKGKDLFKVLRAACFNPVEHYGLESGLLRKGDPADLIVVADLKSFKVKETYIKGALVAENGRTNINSVKEEPINHFHCDEISTGDIGLKVSTDRIRVILAEDGQLITKEVEDTVRIHKGQAICDVDKDILKLVVVNRYEKAPPAIAFIKGFGLKEGAIASSVAHDSHNIIAVGVDDASIVKAINEIIRLKGGISYASENRSGVLPLPVAGLMSVEDGYEVAEKYSMLDAKAKELGSDLASPYMTLSFMALLVIPELKLSDRGLFDGRTFSFVDVEVGSALR